MGTRTVLTAVVCGLFGLLAWSLTFAADLAYTCEVVQVYDLNKDGSLKPSKFNDDMRGSRFTVSRLNGQILGEVLPTLNADKTEVLSHGSTANSFRAIAYFNVGAAGPLVQTIDVKEYLEGREKPFVSFSMGGAGIVTGTCE